MRSIEIVLKFCFLILAVFLIATSSIASVGLWSFVVICFALGIVVTINRKPSYKKANAKKDFALRKIEGAILIIYAFISLALFNLY